MTGSTQTNTDASEPQEPGRSRPRVVIVGAGFGGLQAAEREADLEKRRQDLTFVLVGGGPTGVELAGGMADLMHTTMSGHFRHIRPSSARTILVEGKDRIMPYGRVKVERDLSVLCHPNIFVRFISHSRKILASSQGVPPASDSWTLAGFQVHCRRAWARDRVRTTTWLVL